MIKLNKKKICYFIFLYGTSGIVTHFVSILFIISFQLFPIYFNAFQVAGY